ncbi:heme biosynthesis protein HemY [Pseudotabrizicola alkalilacus]|uniref:Heme biosynthesis protein HemY n=1 Tax=Pseudotabrizicola alkalilacus TaxID=2305252 RepID=A0A411YYF0_9RHOB|nr:heme biosynthesis HemY N-terminal domain-containing protein [Pseudotabrizicola alkalilacus]RGP35818.1 heme biosynthesis protein HemY [Pseudotabrizicola alkalilacus]
MLWTLLKVILFVFFIAALTYGAGVLLDTGGGIRIAVAGWEMTLGPLQAVILSLVLVVSLWVLFKIVSFVVAVLRFLTGDETAISRYFDRNRERKGYQALTEGLLALASGEGQVAMARAQRAERYLAKPDLTNLLMAQSAEAAGDTKRAADAYKRLLADDKTRFVGVRGLMKQKLAEGDTDTALKLAEKAFAMKPRHAETQDILLRLQADHADWKGARLTLGAKLKAGELPRDVYRRRDAVLALQEAKTVFDDSASIEAREAAIEANRLSPDLIPAAAMAARSLVGKGDRKGATRVLKKAWTVHPHPDLAAAFAEIEPEETPTARIKRFKALTDAHPAHEQTRLLQAELYVSAEDFPAARRSLGDIVTTHPTQRSLAIMAAIARGEGEDDSVVRGWLTRALTAPRGPQWCCDKCHAIHAQWHPICDNCGGFDTLSWREPPETSGPSATGTELLPLIVGQPAPPPDPAPEPLTAEDADIVATQPRPD